MKRSTDRITHRTVARGFVTGLAALALWGCANAPASFRADGDGVAPGDTLAVMPLVNLSQQQNAPEVVLNALVVELLGMNAFVVVDPGEVHEVVLAKRFRLTDRLPLEALREIETATGARYVMEGTVNAFGMVDDSGVSYPSVAVTLRLVRCGDGRIVWAGSHARRGDDTESIFGLGRVATLEQLTQDTVSELMETLHNGKR